jgi:hypothetical protein
MSLPYLKSLCEGRGGTKGVIMQWVAYLNTELRGWTDMFAQQSWAADVKGVVSFVQADAHHHNGTWSISIHLSFTGDVLLGQNWHRDNLTEEEYRKRLAASLESVFLKMLTQHHAVKTLQTYESAGKLRVDTTMFRDRERMMMDTEIHGTHVSTTYVGRYVVITLVENNIVPPGDDVDTETTENYKAWVSEVTRMASVGRPSYTRDEFMKHQFGVEFRAHGIRSFQVENQFPDGFTVQVSDVTPARVKFKKSLVKGVRLTVTFQGRKKASTITDSSYDKNVVRTVLWSYVRYLINVHPQFKAFLDKLNPDEAIIPEYAEVRNDGENAVFYITFPISYLLNKKITP